jgi:DNA polymerase III epsilon subunit-like protein
MTKQLRHVMIDLETMGTVPESAIVSIGAVLFDPRYGQVSNEVFYAELDWEEQNRWVDPLTEEWWSTQNSKAKMALHGIEDLEETLTEFSHWLPNDAKVWGNGATFDISLLEHAYRQLSLPIPWKFYNVRDCRTVLDMYESKRGGFNKKSGGTLHNALDDAKYQASYITMMWRNLLKD